MKLGIFSGTFDPVHEGHIWLARESLKQFGLAKVVFLPEPIPRRKLPEASYANRKKMLEIAISGTTGLDVRNIEDESHSVKGTLKFIEQQYDGIDKVKIIMGADVFEYIDSWKNLDYLAREADFVVYLRHEDDGELAVEQANKLRLNIEMISSQYSQVSSSKIREALHSGERPSGLEPKVLKYILENHLYEK